MDANMYIIKIKIDGKVGPFFRSSALLEKFRIENEDCELDI